MLDKVRLAPSILSADFACLGKEARALEAAGADYIHIDVMDNHYVPNLTFGPLVCRALKPHVNIPIDVHLMVEPVDALIPAFAEAGAGIISFHPEASRHVDRTLKLIRDHGCKAGLALNPATPISWIDHVLDKLDVLLLMSVNPGFGGQDFLKSTLTKLEAARQRLDAHVISGGHYVELEIDGGITCGNIGQLVTLGATMVVVGSAIFGAPDYGGGYRGIIEALRVAACSASS